MGQAFMPRRGGSFVKHRHKYVARYEWTPTENESGGVVSATCTRTLVCGCGKVEGEETVTATMRYTSGVDEQVPCWTRYWDVATAVFSDGDIKTRNYNTTLSHDESYMSFIFVSNGDGTHSTNVRECGICYHREETEKMTEVCSGSDGICEYCGGKLN